VSNLQIDADISNGMAHVSYSPRPRRMQNRVIPTSATREDNRLRSRWKHGFILVVHLEERGQRDHGEDFRGEGKDDDFIVVGWSGVLVSNGFVSVMHSAGAKDREELPHMIVDCVDNNGRFHLDCYY